MSSNSEKKFGSCEVCLMACMAYYSSVGKTDVSREDIATFFNTPPSGCELLNPCGHKALSNRPGDKSIGHAKHYLISSLSLTKETVPGRGKK